MKIANFLSTLHIPPYINFNVADVRVSLWLLLAVGLATGYLAGTIGVGGFIGVPAMIYVFGVPTAVAAGSELYLAMFMGGWGALNYAYQGFVDIRLTMLLYLGSLLGIFIGAYGVKVVKELMIRIVTGAIIMLCVMSRAIAVPMYLRQLGWIDDGPGMGHVLQPGQQRHAVCGRHLRRAHHIVQRDQGIPTEAADRDDPDRTAEKRNSRSRISIRSQCMSELHLQVIGSETRERGDPKTGADPWARKRTRRRHEVNKKDEKKTTIDDWMVRISFAEAGEPDLGFKATGLDIVRKTKLALEKIMVVRSEKISGGDDDRRDPPEKSCRS